MTKSKHLTWALWLLLSFMISGYLAFKLNSDDKTIYLPGVTTHGHYQIELACEACHTDSFTSELDLQKACMNCHGEELKIADDSHPKSKFTDPRNADRTAKLDARECITCHTEHQAGITTAMGLSLPEDYCFKCHEDVGKNRPSHVGMAFTTCADAGCHNFHDNRGLYEDFLAKHLDEPNNLENKKLLTLSFFDAYSRLPSYPKKDFPNILLDLSSADYPKQRSIDSMIIQDWMESSHRLSGVNCSACHQAAKTDASVAWLEHPTYEVCKDCHEDQTKGFLSGRHGMRLAQGLGPMKPTMARLPMKSSAQDKQLSCISCHGDHRFDIQQAAVDACLSCHDDKHSLAYKKSAHYRNWQREVIQTGDSTTGASCATCHLPRHEIKRGDQTVVIAQHNQNDNLRPNEKMLRSVCMNCHGLGFSIDALADLEAIEKNFSVKPSVHIESLELTKQRMDLKKDVKGM